MIARNRCFIIPYRYLIIVWRGCLRGESDSEICVRIMNDQSGVGVQPASHHHLLHPQLARSLNIHKLIKHNLVTSDSERGRVK